MNIISILYIRDKAKTTGKVMIINLFVFLISSCLNGQTPSTIETKLTGLENWDYKIERNKTDTINLKSWFPASEIQISLIYKKDSTCLTPTFDFYPIEIEKYIEKRLLNYLILRATIFPPAPKSYRTETFFILGWNLVDYDNFQCCECSDLENELIDRLGLRLKSNPQEIDRMIRGNK